MEQLLTARQLRSLPFSSDQVAQIRVSGFLPAFYDRATMTVEVSRFTNGALAPVHLLDSVPADWVAKRCANGKIVALKESIAAGYLCDGFFYSPDEVAIALGL